MIFNIRIYTVLFITTIFILSSCNSNSSNSAGSSSIQADDNIIDEMEVENHEVEPFIETKLVTIDDFIAESTSISEKLDIDEETVINTVDTYNQFAIALYEYFNGRISLENNLVVAPYSASQVLGMVALGARLGTKDQIEQAFPFLDNLSKDGATILDYSNQSVIVSNDSGTDSDKGFYNRNNVLGHEGYLFLIDYLENIANIYQAELGSFCSGCIVNGMPSFSIAGAEYHRLKLLNIMELNNNWQIPFEEDETFDGLFERQDGTQYWVPMVHREGVFSSYEDNEVIAVELDIASSELSMVVMMPKEGQFESFSESLEENLLNISNSLTPEERVFNLPKFNINSNHDLESFMKQQGMVDAFNEDEADFSGVNDLGYLYLSDFSLNVNFQMDKNSVSGKSTASAINEATADESPFVWNHGYVGNSGGTGFTGTTISCPMIYVKAGEPDARPFIFFIRDKNTNSLLYIGRLLDAGGEEAGTWACGSIWDY